MSNIRSLIVGAIVVILLVIGAVFLVKYLRGNTETDTKVEESITPTGTPIINGDKISLDSQHRSKEKGTIIVADENGKAVLYVNLTGYPIDTLQPVNIYMGTCDELGKVLYSLADTFNGLSVTTLEIPKQYLQNQKPLSVAVLKSNQDDSSVACGEL